PLTKFIGLDNYKEVLADPFFWRAYKVSFMYMIGIVTLVMPTSLLFAILLNSSWLKAKVLFRTLYFVPVISTTAIVGVIMRMIFGNEGALFNSLLIRMGLLDQPINWLLRGEFALPILIVIGGWLFFGMCMVYWLAVLQSLPQ